MVRGISYVREVRDYDGMPVVLRVSVNERGLRIEAWGVREGRNELQNALQWEHAQNRNGKGEIRGELVGSLRSLPAGRRDDSGRARR
jgi:hypothetical protein